MAGARPMAFLRGAFAWTASNANVSGVLGLPRVLGLPCVLEAGEYGMVIDDQRLSLSFILDCPVYTVSMQVRARS
jgi:hypothetical protein